MGISIRMSLSERSYSVTDNSSVVRGLVEYKTTGSGHNGNSQPGTISVCGQKQSFSTSFANNNSSWKTLAYRDFTVGHNADGSKTAYGSASYISGISSGTVYATASNITLTKIPRVSTLSIDKTTVAAGESITATGTKAYSGFTDAIVLKFGSYTQTLTSGIAFTIPESWCDAIPNATSGTATITLTTKNGSSVIGSTSKNITITVPSNVVPSVTNIAVSEGNNVVTAAFGSRFVQNLSTLATTITAAGEYGSTISKYSTSYNSKTYTSATFTTSTITTSGSTTMTANVTDSRGRTAQSTEAITVVPYQSPSIVGVSYIQCNADGTPNINGTYLKVTVGGSVSSVENQNSKTLTVSYKLSDATSYTDVNIVVDDWNFNVSTILPNIDALKKYNIKVTLTDKISSVVQNYVTNTSQGLTVTNSQYVLIISEGKTYTLPIDSSNISWTVNNYGATGIVKHLNYSANLNKPVGVTTIGQFVYPPSSALNESWSNASFDSSNSNLTPIGLTIYKGYTVALVLDTATNQTSLYMFNQEVTNVYKNIVKLAIVKMQTPSGNWNWIAGNETGIYLLDTQGKVAFTNTPNLTDSWKVVETNITQGTIFDADMYTTTTSVCALVGTTEGHKLMSTPLTAFR